MVLSKAAVRGTAGVAAIIAGGAAAGEAIRELSTGLYFALSPEWPGAPHPDTGLFSTMSFLEPVTIVRIIIVTALGVAFFGPGLRELGLRFEHIRGAQVASLGLLAIAGAAFVETMIRVWFAVFVFPAAQAQQVAFQASIQVDPPVTFGFPEEVTQLLFVWSLITLASLALGLMMFFRSRSGVRMTRPANVLPVPGRA